MTYSLIAVKMKTAGIFAACILILGSTSAQGAVPCAHVEITSGFLPSVQGGTRGRIPLICGLPASQNPVVGISPEHDRLRNQQNKDWSRSIGVAPPEKLRSKDLVDSKTSPVSD